MSDRSLTLFLSHKCDERMCGKRVNSLANRLAQSLSRHNITLRIDPFDYGDDVTVGMQSVEFDALLFLMTPESWASKSCRIELDTALRQGTPIFVALLEGDLPDELSHRLSWNVQNLNGEALAEQVDDLARAIRSRVLIRRDIQSLAKANPVDVTREAAENVATSKERAVVAEYAHELAQRYRLLTDPATCFWIALALGNAGTPDAEELLRGLPPKGHPLPSEGIQQALETIAHAKTVL